MVTHEGRGRFAREDAWAVLKRFGVSSAERATGTGADEEIILLPRSDFAKIDAKVLALALMEVLPHMKVWVIEQHSAWQTEPF